MESRERQTFIKRDQLFVPIICYVWRHELGHVVHVRIVEIELCRVIQSGNEMDFRRIYVASGTFHSS